METKRMSNIPTSDQVLAQQRADHDMPPKPETPKPETNVPAVTNSEAAIDSFLTEFAGGGGATFFKFTKGRYVDRDGEEIAKRLSLSALTSKFKSAGFALTAKEIRQHVTWDPCLAVS